MQNIVSFTDVENYIARVYAGKRCAVKPYFIGFDFGDVAVSTVATVQQKIPSNADFVVSRMSFSIQNYNSSLNPYIQFIDGGTNEQFYSSSVPVYSVCDSVFNGLQDQSTYRRLAGNSLISGTLTNDDAGALTNAIITMAGVLVYVYS